MLGVTRASPPLLRPPVQLHSTTTNLSPDARVRPARVARHVEGRSVVEGQPQQRRAAAPMPDELGDCPARVLLGVADDGGDGCGGGAAEHGAVGVVAADLVTGNAQRQRQGKWRDSDRFFALSERD